MKLLRVGLVVVVICASLAGACTTTVVDSTPPPASAADAGQEDAIVSPVEDGGASDVERPPPKPAKRLDVSCTADPCYVAVSGNGGEHFCGLLKDETVRCWGRDSRAGDWSGGGALGRGASVTPIEGATPEPVVGLEKVTQISVGKNNGTCARTSVGDVYCWGYNQYGQLGRDPRQHPRIATPMRVEGIPPVSYVALGASTACAIASADGALYCWGLRGSPIGQAATPGDSPAFPPQAMATIRGPIRELTLATFSFNGEETNDTIVALREGNVLATLGELPLGESSLPAGSTAIPFEVSGVLKTGAFAYITTDGVLSQWAPNTRAVNVPDPFSIVDVAVSARYVHEGRLHIEEQGAVLLSSGRLFRWGVNNAGELGRHPDAVTEIEHPVEMTHLGKPVVSFATTSSAACASLVDGKVVCWGGNDNGELGRGELDDEHHPEAAEIE